MAANLVVKKILRRETRTWQGPELRTCHATPLRPEAMPGFRCMRHSLRLGATRFVLKLRACQQLLAEFIDQADERKDGSWLDDRLLVKLIRGVATLSNGVGIDNALLVDQHVRLLEIKAMVAISVGTAVGPTRIPKTNLGGSFTRALLSTLTAISNCKPGMSV